ncbi:ibr finger domain protein [Botrytis cinerea]
MSRYNRDRALPGQFLGRGLSEYRKDGLKQILAFLQQTVQSRDNKGQMIDHLNQLRNSGNVSRNQLNSIEAWLQNGATGSITDHHNPRKEDLPDQRHLSLPNAQELSRAHVEVYDKNALLSYISNDPNFTNCLGPNCGAGQIHQDGDAQPIMTCGSCDFKTCFIHKMPWHTGLTCAQHDARQREGASKQEQKSQRLIKKATKKCPSCDVPILKNKGCDHMTCTHCDYEFCWICLADYELILTTSNAAHDSKCAHYRPDGSGPRYAF